jgi:glycosyltransferase involved in cell wall biosynthesis
MRIVIDIRHLTRPEQSGVGEYTVNLLHALFSFPTEHSFFLLSSGSKAAWENVPRFSAPNIQHIHVPVPNRLLNASLLATRRPFLDALTLGPDACRAPDDLAFFFPNLNMISLPTHVPYVLTLHDLSFEIFPHFYSRKSRLWHRLARPRRLATRARTIITPSQATKEDVARLYGVPKARIQVIPHGLTSAFSPKPEPGDHGVRSRYRLPKRFALMVGTLEARKNVRMVEEALARYRAETADELHLALAGKATPYFERLTRELPLEHQKYVHHLGYVPTEHRPALYRLAHVTLFPSIYEGFGLPILESMASGTPVITSHTSSMPDVSGNAAILINPFNASDLVLTLKELMRSDPLKHRLRERGLEHAQRFSWDAAARNTLRVLTASVH